MWTLRASVELGEGSVPSVFSAVPREDQVKANVSEYHNS